ncbi:GntR family transcriptional regulator [Actinosynnema pretiosum subsp. pretiosum]|uniref:Transcriptional regulator, GntR family n=2 Tax=Actinosynnema TaxID=40566 RepID=C6WSC0_ACTMD|nr:GntR family transcriptional regulator [Actinosynnema mirum]ACU40790.1 transcriptional regulator, GntR family [Actinosynnema mirum DSM 43827]AXX34297.1 Transcriptional regulator, GntR family [Actinosynnema pretiosum subsp. pretiosum]QUF01995.1 GntR family transcriptional regulator [Actinosynnema pretiosum subsp. pretiosum]
MTTAEAGTWLRALAEDGARMSRSSTAERVADALRARVLDGAIRAGSQLSEKSLGDALRVSRNTLREAFRLLTHERLLVHEHSRGVFVRVPSTEDVADLYAARRVIEAGALRRWPDAPEERRARVGDAVRWAERLRDDEDWVGVGTANGRFHAAITALAGSSRLDEEMRRLLAELRLVFQVVGDPEGFHRDYLPRNRAIADLLESGEVDAAESALLSYLDTAEEHVTRGLGTL